MQRPGRRRRRASLALTVAAVALVYARLVGALTSGVAARHVPKRSPRCVLAGAVGFGGGGTSPTSSPKKKKKKQPKDKERFEDDRLCPCHSGEPYAACCGPHHADPAGVPSARALLRARYSAFALNLPTFVAATTDASNPRYRADDRDAWLRDIAKGLKATRFTALRILDERVLDDDDATREILFEADMQPVSQGGHGAKAIVVTERATFVRREQHEGGSSVKNKSGVWLYARGDDINAETLAKGVAPTAS